MTSSRDPSQRSKQLLLAAVFASLSAILIVWSLTRSTGTGPRAVSAELTQTVATPEPIVIRKDAISRQRADPALHSSDTAAVDGNMAVVVVSATSQAPIEGAEVWVAPTTAREGQRRRAVTDGSGEARFELEWPGEPHVVGAAAEGFAVSVEFVTPERDPRIEIVLDVGTEITGRVVCFDRGTLPADVAVFAWTGSRPTERVLRNVSNGFPGVLISEVAPDGRFSIGGAHADLHYTVAAGAPGWTTLHFPVRPPGAQKSISVELRPLFAGIVKVHLPDGSDPPHVRGAKWSVALPEYAHRVSYPSMRLRLAGIWSIEDVRPGLLYDWRNRFVAVIGEQRHRDIAATFQLQVPGFQRVETETLVPHASKGVAVIKHPVFPVAPAFGSLRLEFADGASAPAPRGFPTATLNLVDGSGSIIQTPIRSLHGSEGLPALPIGTYRAWITSDFSGRIPLSYGGNRAQIDVVAGHEARLKFDCSGLGAIIFEETSGRATWESRSCTVRFHPSGKQAALFFEPPYVLQGLRPGRYDVQLSSGADTNRRVAIINDIAVEPGSVTRRSFSWE